MHYLCPHQTTDTAMAITIRKVNSKRDLKRFIRFNYELYKGNP